MKISRMIAAGLFCAIFVAVAAAASNPTLYYKGFLATTNGGTIPLASGSYSVTFKLYESGTSLGVIWSETQTVPVSGGFFSVQLGSVNPLSADLLSLYPTSWLTMQRSGLNESGRTELGYGAYVGFIMKSLALLSSYTGVPKMIPIPAGTFMMGQTGIATPIHQVTVSRFSMRQTEVTQGEYMRVMGVNPSVKNPGMLTCPVENISWYDAALFCNKLSKAEGKDTVYSYTNIVGTIGNGCSGLTALAINYAKKGYRLPTEAEWEYACRAGTTGTYYFPDSMIASNAWYGPNSGLTTHAVAQKTPNAFGLYDMSGNVQEFCADLSAAYTATAATNPTGPASGYNRVVRGGGYGDGTSNMYASASRNPSRFPETRSSIIGFRVVLCP